MVEQAEPAGRPAIARTSTRPQSASSGTSVAADGGMATTVLRLQHTAGNAAVAGMLARRPPKTPARQAFLQRKGPEASMPGPNASVSPPKPDLHNNGLPYQGETIYPDPQRCYDILRTRLSHYGAEMTSSYGTSMVHAPAEQRATWALFADDEYMTRCQDAMQVAVTRFDEENRIFLEKFETRAGNVTDQLLINAEEQIHAEQTKLGLKGTEVGDYDSGTTTLYSASNTVYLTAAKSAAANLATMRELADFRGGKAAEVRKKAAEAKAQLPKDFDPEKTFPPPAPGGPDIITEQEAVERDWKQSEDDFKSKAKEATASYPLLGSLLTGGGGTAQKLR
jgi:hypothetical protein